MTNLVVRTQVKDILKESGLGLDNLSGDFMDKLDETIEKTADKLVDRPEEVYQLYLQAIDRIEKLHKMNISHNDIKSENIMVIEWGEKLGDLYNTFKEKAQIVYIEIKYSTEATRVIQIKK